MGNIQDGNYNMRLMIGIDPDVKKSGFAINDMDKHRLTDVTCLKFYDLLDGLKEVHQAGHIVEVKISAGWLIKKSNFHKYKNEYVGMKQAMNVGRNHQVGLFIVEYCELYHIPFSLVRPTGKVDTGNFNKRTGWQGSTNSDSRDAAMLVYGY